MAAAAATRAVADGAGLGQQAAAGVATAHRAAREWVEVVKVWVEAARVRAIAVMTWVKVATPVLQQQPLVPREPAVVLAVGVAVVLAQQGSV